MPRRAPKKALWSEEGRLATFKDWPFNENVSCTPVKMAMAGFYCPRGKKDPNDLVSCFMCGKDLDGWEPDDEPMKEHAKHSSACPFINLHLEENRLKTFKHWPFKKGNLKNKQAFAHAGFVHNPSDVAGWDNVRCFTCDKHLGGWEEEDDPMEEHKNHCKNCPFVLAMAVDEAEVEEQATVQHDAQEEEFEPTTKNNTDDNQTETDVETVTKDDSIIKQPEPVPTTAKKRAASKRKAPTTAPKRRKAVKKAVEPVDVQNDSVAIDSETVVSDPDDTDTEDVDDSMTVEQYLRVQCETQANQLVQACEVRIAEFAEMAAKVRLQLVAM